MNEYDYVYLGDKFSLDGDYNNRKCKAVRRIDGKCVRGKNSNMLVDFDGIKVVVLARRLRKINY